MKRLVSLCYIVILVFTLFWSCTEKELEIPVASITLSQPAAEMIEGETIILKATILPSNATVREIIWASSKQSVATVDQSGKVVAIAEGTSTITATAGGKVGSCVVTISKGVVNISSIKLDKTSASLKVGEKVTLTATVKPDDATDKTVTWNSSDASVAEVNNGVVTAKKIGTATITAKAGDKEATCAITVESTPVISITLDRTSASLKVGETVALTGTIKPDDATDKTVTWSSSDASVATVSNGVVTAKKVGTATIKATANDGSGVYATCDVVVYINTPIAVNLGLSVKWASFNLGASSPEEYGEYYAWGETEPKGDYSWSTYKWYNNDDNSLTKYNTHSSYGTVDNKIVLDKKDDVAYINLGGKWRLPTDQEWIELWKNCTRIWTTQNGVSGYLLTSLRNGASIFLPASGIRSISDLFLINSSGYYWSSSLFTDNSQSATVFDFDSNGFHRGGNYRCYGQSVRPVSD